MLVAAATLLSCTSTKDNSLAYFKDLETSPNGTLANPQGIYPIRIQPDEFGDMIVDFGDLVHVDSRHDSLVGA